MSEIATTSPNSIAQPELSTEQLRRLVYLAYLRCLAQSAQALQAVVASNPDDPRIESWDDGLDAGMEDGRAIFEKGPQMNAKQSRQTLIPAEMQLVALQVLRDYDGPHALSQSKEGNEPIVRLRVPADCVAEFPASATVSGQVFRVVADRSMGNLIALNSSDTPMTPLEGIAIFDMGNDCDWYAARNLEEAKAYYAKDYDGIIDADDITRDTASARPITESEAERLRFIQHEGQSAPAISFREALVNMIKAGASFPCLFASTEF